MKSLKYLLIGLFICLTPIIVRADAGGPSFTEYDVIVSNAQGTDIVSFDYDGSKQVATVVKHVEYNDIIKNIYMEEYINDELYGFCPSDNGYVKLSDVKPYGNIDFTKFENYASGKIYVYKEGAYLYKGPSSVYGKVDKEVMIPVGTELEYTYRDDLFAYVTYKGVSGWVYIYDFEFGPYKDVSSAIIMEKRNGNLYTVSDTYLYTLPEYGEKEKTYIPKNTKIDFKYVYKYNKGYYVEYNGKKGWILDKVGIIENDLKLFTHLEGVNICETVDCTKNVGKIPKNTIVPVEYGIYDGEAWYYVNYNGIKGYVYLEEYYSGPVHTSFNAKYELTVDAKLYSDIYGKETDTVINAGEIIADFIIYNNNDYSDGYIWVHIYEGEHTGWIKVNDSQILFTEALSSDASSTSNNSIIPVDDFLLYSVFGTLVLAATIVVVIVLVNKKKETKIEANKE